MLNIKEIELMQIKNLEMIYFSNLENKPFLSLNIVYDNGKNLSYNYTYEYFNQFVSKVAEVYKKEKENNKVQFIDIESKNLIESLIIGEVCIKEEQKCNTCDRINKYNTRTLDFKFLMGYIKRIIKQFIYYIENDESLEIEIIGYKDKYVIKYNDQIIPIFLIKQDENHYKIKFKYTNEEYNINMFLTGSIDLYKDCIALNYTSSDNSITGKNIYHIDDSKSSEIIKHFGNIVSYGEIDNDIDNDIIDFYLNLLQLPILEKRIKTVSNNYYIVSNIDSNTKYIIHMSLDKDYVNVRVDKIYGIVRDDIFVTIEEEKTNINIMLEDKRLVIEKHYLDTPITRGEYKKNYENKYSYDFYEIDSCDLTKKFNIVNEKKKIK